LAMSLVSRRTAGVESRHRRRRPPTTGGIEQASVMTPPRARTRRQLGARANAVTAAATASTPERWPVRRCERRSGMDRRSGASWRALLLLGGEKISCNREPRPRMSRSDSAATSPWMGDCVSIRTAGRYRRATGSLGTWCARRAIYCAALSLHLLVLMLCDQRVEPAFHES
jgi:hypothetical protein